MKPAFIFCLLFAFAAIAFSQEDTTKLHTLMKADLLKKSKNQMTTAWIFLGTGTTLMIAGLVVSENTVENDQTGSAKSNNNNFGTGGVLLGIGGAFDIASIPFFIAGSKNRARAMSVKIKNDFLPQLRQGAIARLPGPTVGLVLKL